MPGWFKPPRSRWGLNGQLVHSVWWSSRQRRRPRATSEETGEKHRDKPTKWKTTAAGKKRSRIFEKQKQGKFFHEAIWLNRTACFLEKTQVSHSVRRKYSRLWKAFWEIKAANDANKSSLTSWFWFYRQLLSVNNLKFVFSILMSKNNVAVKITSETTTTLKTTHPST